MSLIYPAIRLCATALLLTVNALLVGLYSLSLSVHSGGASEISCLAIAFLVILVIIAEAVYLLCWRANHRDQTWIRHFSYTMFLFSGIESLIITGRAIRPYALTDDFATLSNPYGAANAVLVLSWLSFILVSSVLMINYFESISETDQATQFTVAPERHNASYYKTLSSLKDLQLVEEQEKYEEPAIQSPPPSRVQWVGRQFHQERRVTYIEYPEIV